MTGGFKVTIYDYLRVIFHRKWIIALSMTLALAASGVYAFFVAKEVWHGYNHRVQVLDKLGKRQIKQLYSDEALKERIYSIYQRLSTQVFAERLMADLLAQPEFAEHAIDFDGAVKRYLDTMTLVLKGEYVAIDVEMVGPPALSKAIVERLYEQMVAINDDDERQTIDTARGVVEQSRESLQGSWEKSIREYFDDLDPESFEALAVTGRLPGAGKFETDQVILTALALKRDARRELDVVDRSISGLTGELAALTRQRDEIPERIKGDLVMQANPVVVELRDQLMRERRELRRLQTDATMEHPLVQERLHRIRLLQELMSGEPAEIPKSRSTVVNPSRTELEIRIAESHARIEGLGRQRETLEIQVVNADAALETLSSRLGRLEESRAKADLYKTAQNRLQLKEIDVVLESTFRDRFSFVKMDDTRVSSSPVRPNKPLVMVAGLMLGVVMSCFFVFIVEYADHSIKGIEDARRYLSIPVFAAIPAMGSPAASASAASQSPRKFGGPAQHGSKRSKAAGGLLGAAAVLLALAGVGYWLFYHDGEAGGARDINEWVAQPPIDATADVLPAFETEPGSQTATGGEAVEPHEPSARLDAMRLWREPLLELPEPGGLPAQTNP